MLNATNKQVKINELKRVDFLVDSHFLVSYVLERYDQFVVEFEINYSKPAIRRALKNQK